MIPNLKPSISQDYIVNLSTINKLKPLSEVLDEFADLHYQYAQSWLHYKWYSKLWVSSKYLTMTHAINDYKLGKIDTDTFIKKLQEIFYFIPTDKNPKKLLENAWNSLISWDEQSTQRLNYLITKNQPIYLISNTNELNIEKIKHDIDSATKKTWDWQEQTLGKCKFQISENFRLMTSYENSVFKTEGLTANLVEQLLIEGKIHENIMLVSQYQPDLAKAKALGIKSKPADQFFPAVPVSSLTASQAPLNSIAMSSTTTAPTPILFIANNLASSRRNFFSHVPKNENSETRPEETTPLLRQ
ncbi:hypothetical protein [Rickettsiella endosymbiont of Miltochrista miniata]|uniref:hypothetical protein n=1 Tax=Rickettsiella endosymbiont of Miltochrista miniata TaxID=3066239 RepID=UPI00313CD852